PGASRPVTRETYPMFPRLRPAYPSSYEPHPRRFPDSRGRPAVPRHDFVIKWRARRDELARLGAQVDGAKLCDEALADFEAVITAEDEALLGLHDAAARSGYSSDHLRRLHRLG